MGSAKSSFNWGKKSVALGLSAAMAASFVPAAALADEFEQPVGDDVAAEFASSVDATAIQMLSDAADYPALQSEGTVDAGNGWVLNYATVDGGAAITGVATAGSGALTIPETADSLSVVGIANKAFMGSKAIGAVTLPESVTSIGLYAFMNSSITSINIPSGVNRIAYRCFALCTSLASVSFEVFDEGGSMGYLSQQSFYNCTSLTSLNIPLLKSTPTLDEAKADGLNDGSVSFGSAVGASCFEKCSKLARITFGGPVIQDQPNYFVNTSCLTGCPSNLEIVCFGATVSLPSGTSTASVLTASTSYYTIDYYDSASDAQNLSNRKGSLTYKAVTRTQNSKGNIISDYKVRMFEAAYGKSAALAYRYSGSVSSTAPSCPAGKVWALIGTEGDEDSDTQYNQYSYLGGSFQAVAVSPADVQYGWISSPSIDKLYKALNDSINAGGMGYGDAVATIAMNADGTIPEIAQIGVQTTDGSMVGSGSYTLVYEKGKVEQTTTASGRIDSVTEWSPIDVKNITGEGYYRVHAVGKGAYASSVTDSVVFKVEAPSPDITNYDESNMSAYLGSASYTASEGLDGKAAYNVVVPASDWRNQLLGAGFAGAGKGLLLTDCGNDYSNNMMQAAINSGSDSYLIIGNDEAVPQSANVTDERYLADFVAERTGAYGTRYGADATTAQELSSAAIGKFKPDRWNAAWGSTAVVASAGDELITEAAAQYVYGNAARVFFLKDDGTLADADLASLADGGITSIVLVGDEGSVSASVASQIASSTGKTPTRILEGSNASSVSLSLAAELASAGSNSFISVVIADASKSANVSTGAVLAENQGGVLLTCRTTEDAKMLEAYFEWMVKSSGRSCIEGISLVGDFSYLSDAESFFNTPWTAAFSDLKNAGDVTLAVGDTIERDGVIYVVASSDTVVPVSLSGWSSYEGLPTSITASTSTYAVKEHSSFSDVPDGQWYSDAVQFCVARGLFHGYDDGRFGVGNTITRAELALMLWRYADPASATNEPAKNATGLPDVADDQWYTAACNWAFSQGVINGYKDASGNVVSFGPSDTVTLEQLAQIFKNLKGPGDSADTSILGSFTDGGAVDDWARVAVAWSIDKGFFSGSVNADGSKSIIPTDAINRERVARIMYNGFAQAIL